MLVVLLAVAVVFGAPVRALPHSSLEIYYSDYFATEVGWETWSCSHQYDYAGTLDGAYKMLYIENCTTPANHTFCFENVNGEWEDYPCPF